MHTLTFYKDPGHGWLKVPMHMIDELGLSAQISRYSYRNGTSAYLEEDCDAPLFIREAEKSGIALRFTERHHNSPSFIRRLPHWITP